MTTICIMKLGTTMKSPYTVRVALGQTASPLEVVLSSGCTVMSIQCHQSSVETSCSSSAASSNHFSKFCGIMVHLCCNYIRHFGEGLVFMINMKSFSLSVVCNLNLNPVITRTFPSNSKKLW